MVWKKHEAEPPPSALTIVIRMDSWRFELNLNNIEYDPKEVRFLDIWHEQVCLLNHNGHRLIDAKPIDRIPSSLRSAKEPSTQKHWTHTCLFDNKDLGLAEVGSDHHGKSSALPSLRLMSGPNQLSDLLGSALYLRMSKIHLV
jgi:hypothetical protein